MKAVDRTGSGMATRMGSRRNVLVVLCMALLVFFGVWNTIGRPLPFGLDRPASGVGATQLLLGMSGKAASTPVVEQRFGPGRNPNDLREISRVLTSSGVANEVRTVSADVLLREKLVGIGAFENKQVYIFKPTPYNQIELMVWRSKTMASGEVLSAEEFKRRYRGQAVVPLQNPLDGAKSSRKPKDG